MTFTRKNAWTNGGTFDNPDLLWYAKAVGVMKSKPISDPTSWWFYAAIHDEYLVTQTPENLPYLNWTKIKSLPQDKLSPLPPQSLQETFWEQCTHKSWFFLPWHRGYLVSFEDKLRDIIIGLGGPEDWALPYCNVNEDQNYIPPAFTQHLLDGTPNPLFVPERYGNKFSDLNEKCQEKTPFNKYGGTNHDQVYSAIESNPHNLGHTDIGGQSTLGQYGLMSIVPTAALDPIFYLHHCNIDRLWAAWNKTSQNPTSPDWLDSLNPRKPFAMPMNAAGDKWLYTCKDVTDTNVKYYKGRIYQFTYDDPAQVPSTQDALAVRLNKLNLNFDGNTNFKISMEPNTELLGANISMLDLSNNKVETTVKLEKSAWGEVEKSLLAASPTNIPDEVYLHLEGVKGNEEGNSLLVFVNQKFIERVSLFGLASASSPDGLHSGAGVDLRIDITDIIDKLHLAKGFDVDSLDIKIETNFEVSESSKLTIDRVSVYRVDQEK
jgi:tyrosinase